MLKYIFRLVTILKKKWLLEQVRMEDAFFREFFRKDLNQNEDNLRKEIVEMKEHPDEKNTDRLLEIERKVNTLAQVRMRLKNGKQVESELLAFIRIAKRDLWK